MPMYKKFTLLPAFFDEIVAAQFHEIGIFLGAVIILEILEVIDILIQMNLLTEFYTNGM